MMFRNLTVYVEYRIKGRNIKRQGPYCGAVFARVVQNGEFGKPLCTPVPSVDLVLNNVMVALKETTHQITFEFEPELNRDPIIYTQSARRIGGALWNVAPVPDTWESSLPGARLRKVC